MVPVGRRHGAGLLGRDVERSIDRLHPRIRLQWLQRREHGLLEAGVGDRHRGTAKNEDEGRAGAILRQQNGAGSSFVLVFGSASMAKDEPAPFCGSWSCMRARMAQNGAGSSFAIEA